jgi:hypothetical protein
MNNADQETIVARFNADLSFFKDNERELKKILKYVRRRYQAQIREKDKAAHRQHVVSSKPFSD